MRKRFLPILFVLLMILLAGCSKPSELPQNTEISSPSVGEFSELKQDENLTDEPSIAETESTASSTENEVVSEPTENQEKEVEKPTSSSVSKPTEEHPKTTENTESKPVETKPNETKPTETQKPTVIEPANDTDEQIPEQTTTQPSVSEEVIETEKPQPSINEDVFTQEDHERIVSEVTAYAESYVAKGFIFEWKELMEFSWEVGYMGTPRVEYEGVDGVIKTLKYHIDLIYQTSTNPAYGITTDYMTYKVVQIEVDGDLAYSVIYGG